MRCRICGREIKASEIPTYWTGGVHRIVTCPEHTILLSETLPKHGPELGTRQRVEAAVSSLINLRLADAVSKGPGAVAAWVNEALDDADRGARKSIAYGFLYGSSAEQLSEILAKTRTPEAVLAQSRMYQKINHSFVSGFIPAKPSSLRLDQCTNDGLGWPAPESWKVEREKVQEQEQMPFYPHGFALYEFSPEGGLYLGRRRVETTHDRLYADVHDVWCTESPAGGWGISEIERGRYDGVKGAFEYANVYWVALDTLWEIVRGGDRLELWMEGAVKKLAEVKASLVPQDVMDLFAAYTNGKPDSVVLVPEAPGQNEKKQPGVIRDHSGHGNDLTVKPGTPVGSVFALTSGAQPRYPRHAKLAPIFKFYGWVGDLDVYGDVDEFFAPRRPKCEAPPRGAVASVRPNMPADETPLYTQLRGIRDLVGVADLKLATSVAGLALFATDMVLRLGGRDKLQEEIDREVAHEKRHGEPCAGCGKPSTVWLDEDETVRCCDECDVLIPPTTGDTIVSADDVVGWVKRLRDPYARHTLWEQRVRIWYGAMGREGLDPKGIVHAEAVWRVQDQAAGRLGRALDEEQYARHQREFKPLRTDADVRKANERLRLLLSGDLVGRRLR